MYHSGKSALRRLEYKSEAVGTFKGKRQRRLHKAFLRYHDPKNWPLLREALKRMGRAELIGSGKQHLIPAWQPATDGAYQAPRRKNATAAAPDAQRKKRRAPAQPVRGKVLTQHTGLPPRKRG